MSKPTPATPVKPQSRNPLSQSSASVPTWNSWESLGFSDEQPCKAEYFVKKNYPKQLVRVLESQYEKEKREMGRLVLPLTIRRVRGRETVDYIVNTQDEEEEEEDDDDCDTTEEYSSEELLTPPQSSSFSWKK